MAIASILETLDDSRGVDTLERVYTAADNPARFSSRGFAQALTKLRETLK